MLLRDRITCRGYGSGCLDRVVHLPGVLLERLLKSGIWHDCLPNAGLRGDRLSSTHVVLLTRQFAGPIYCIQRELHFGDFRIGKVLAPRVRHRGYSWFRKYSHYLAL